MHNILPCIMTNQQDNSRHITHSVYESNAKVEPKAKRLEAYKSNGYVPQTLCSAHLMCTESAPEDKYACTRKSHKYIEKH